jgi:hypothetical protein
VERVGAPASRAVARQRQWASTDQQADWPRFPVVMLLMQLHHVIRIIDRISRLMALERI